MKKKMLSMFLVIAMVAGLMPTTALAAGDYGKYEPDGVKVTSTSALDDDENYITVKWVTMNDVNSTVNQTNLQNSYVYIKFKNGKVGQALNDHSGWRTTTIEQEGDTQVLKMYFSLDLLKNGEGKEAYCNLRVYPGATISEIGAVSELSSSRDFGGALTFYRGKDSRQPAEKIDISYKIKYYGQEEILDYYRIGSPSAAAYNFSDKVTCEDNVLWATNAGGISMNTVGLKSASISADKPSLPNSEVISNPISLSAVTALGVDAEKAYTGAANSANGLDKAVYAKVSSIKYTGTDYGDSIYFSEKDGQLYLNVNESIYDKIGSATYIEMPLTADVEQTLTSNTVTCSKTIKLTRPQVGRTASLSNLSLQWPSGNRYYRTYHKARLTADEGYELPDSITVTVGGNLLTEGTDYIYTRGLNKNNGTVEFPASTVTGDININASADKKAVPLDSIAGILLGFDGGIWYNETNSTFQTASGWTVSSSRNDTFSDSVKLDGNGNPVTKTLYFQNGDGNLYSYELTYKRDITAPAIEEISGFPEEEDYKTSAEITFTVSDALSGIKSVKVTCDDGEDVDFDKDSFTADRNGTYTVTVTDEMGNQKIEKVTVQSIHVHSYTYYTNPKNAAKVIESCVCGHEETAVLDYSEGSGSYTYTGSAITPVKATYSAGWAGDKPADIVYSDNIDASTEAKATLDIGGATATKTFEISSYDISSADVTINPASGKYTGLPHTPEVSVSLIQFGTLTEGTDYDVSWGEKELTNAGTYTATIKGKGNFTGQLQGGFEVTNGWNPEVNREYTVSEPNGSGWLNDDFAVTAMPGYELSFTNIAGGQWKDTLIGTAEGADSRMSFYVKNIEDGTISEMATESYKLDKVSPVGKVFLDERNGWESFMNTITFGLFYKDEVTVKAEASDGLSGVEKIEFIEASEAMSLEELKNRQEGWEVLPEDGESVTFNDAKQFIYYIRITDKAGNEAYISTDGAEYDATAPAIGGIENSATYYTTQKVTVTDKNLYSVKLNEEESTANITLNGNTDKAHTIVATDKAGNITTVFVTMKPIASISIPINGITEENVRSSDEEAISSVITKASELLEEQDLTDEEKAALEKIKSDAGKLEDKLKATSDTFKDLTDKAGSYDEKTVTSGDKQGIQDLINSVDVLLETDNLTEDEKAEMEEAKKTAENLIGKIESTAKESREITDKVAELDKGMATSDDKQATLELIDRVDELLKGENLTDDEREALEEVKKSAEEAIAQIEAAGKATITENTDKVKNITHENVTVEDKADLEGAKADMEEALKEYGSNMTDEERKAIQEEIDRIDEAIAVIEKIENLQVLIEKIPDKLTKGNANAVKAAQDAYNALSDYEKTLIDTNKMDKAVKALEKLNSPNTGDDTHIFLWLVLMLSAVFGGVKINVYSKKKNIR